VADHAQGADGEADDGDDGGAGGSVPTPTRTVTPHVVQPEQTARVRLDVPDAVGRVLIRETAPGELPSLVDASPEPVRTVVAAGSIYAVWELDEPGDVSLTYEVRVPDATREGERLRFDGELVAGSGTAETAGRDVVPVVDDLFERILVQDDVTGQDVALAADLLERGQLSAAQFELVAEKWLGRDAVEPAQFLPAEN